MTVVVVPPQSYSNRRIRYSEPSPEQLFSPRVKTLKGISSETGGVSTNFNNYKALRSIILDKANEIILTFDDPNSSINRGLGHIGGKFGRSHYFKFQKMIDQIYQNSDKLLSSDKIDQYEYFDAFYHLRKNLNGFQAEVLPYVYQADMIDASHPQEAYDNINRLYEDVSTLFERENRFSKKLRENYIQHFTKTKG